MQSVISKVCAIAGSSIVLMARLKKSTDTYVVQSDVSAIRVDCYDLVGDFSQPTVTSSGTVVAPTVRTPVDSTGTPITNGAAYDTPAVSASVYNSLQTDSRWGVDSTGYNFAYKLATPLIDHIYEVRITFTVTNGDKLVVVFQIDSE